MRRYHVHGTRTLAHSIRSFSFPVHAPSLALAREAAGNIIWNATLDGATYAYDVTESCPESRKIA